MIEKMWTVAEISQTLNRSEYCIREDIKAGKFGTPVKAGNKYLIPESQIETYIQQSKDSEPFVRHYSTGRKNKSRTGYVPKRLEVV